MSHGFDLAQFIVCNLDAVTATNGIFIQQRPLPASGAASHFSQGDDSAPKGEVENEDYTAVLGRFESGAIGVFESSRVAVGPRAEYIIEVYGSKGSLRDRKSTRLNSSHVSISYAVFCLTKQ